jgi:hypothetical protein
MIIHEVPLCSPFCSPFLPTTRANDPLADAAGAVKKLRQNASDEQAADALERELGRLREHDDQAGPLALEGKGVTQGSCRNDH